MCFVDVYKNLTDSWRKITGKSPKDGRYRCDKEKRGGFETEGWYRFVGDAGTHLSTKPPGFLRPLDSGLTESGTSYKECCGTNYVGWMKGEHPTINDGLVTREFCFHTTTGECQWTVMSQVRTCPVKDEYTVFRGRVWNTETFYVYYLKFPKFLTCNAGYCAL